MASIKASDQCFLCGKRFTAGDKAVLLAPGVTLTKAGFSGVRTPEIGQLRVKFRGGTSNKFLMCTEHMEQIEGMLHKEKENGTDAGSEGNGKKNDTGSGGIT